MSRGRRKPGKWWGRAGWSSYRQWDKSFVACKLKRHGECQFFHRKHKNLCECFCHGERRREWERLRERATRDRAMRANRPEEPR